jgi:hypothetical protein
MGGAPNTYGSAARSEYRLSDDEWRNDMRIALVAAAAALAMTSLDARAQTELAAYADANGYLDVQS